MWQRAPLIRQFHFAVLLAALILLSGGCGGHRQSFLGGEHPAVDPSAAPQTPLTPGGWTASFPPPADFAGLIEGPRRTSYIEEDLIKHGKDYVSGLPESKVTQEQDAVKFTPAWSEANGLTPANLAYCTYQFTIPGYDREPEIRYGWDLPPTEIDTAWLGLANWDTDSWDWRTCNSEGLASFSTLNPYIDGSDTLLAIFLLANAETSQLRWIRLGPTAIRPALSVSPHSGIGPFNATLDASASTTDVGTLKTFTWDFDGDGVVDDFTGPNSSTSHIYSSTGQFTAKVLVRNSYSVPAVASVTVDVRGGWAHTYGGSDRERVRDVVVAGDAIYVTGGVTSATGTDVLLVKFDLEGHPLWARSWGGSESDEAFGVTGGADGAIYTTGSTISYGGGMGDMLVQRWNADGNVVWSRTWGGSNYDTGQGVGFGSSLVFAAGRTNSAGSGGSDVCVMTFDPDGNYNWGRVVGGSEDEEVLDAMTLYQVLPDATSIHIAGSSDSYAAQQEMLYVEFTEDGTLLSYFTWNAPYRSYGKCIWVSGLVVASAYVAGHLGNSSSEQVLVAQVGLTPQAFTWGGAESDSPLDMIRIGDDLVLSGYTYSFSTVFNPFLLRLDTAGNFKGAEIYVNSDDQGEFSALAHYPDSGLLIGGSDESLQDSAWLPVSSTVAAVAGSWQDHSEIAHVPLLMPDTVDLAAADLTGNVLDTGGGINDSLVIARQLP